MAYLETPELKSGDHMILQEGMTFAVDGGISIEGQFGGRIGDSIVVTAEGFEYLTEYPREVVVVNR
jgi:Xaa-Pro aminopeptidase